jgi:hydrogenase 3 maturation protease
MDFFVMCIGNPQGGDDAIGPYIARKLKELNIDVIDCGTTPENYTSVVKQINPKKLIIIDAVDMGLKPGEIRIVPKEKIGVMTISTHGIPTSILMNYLEQYVKELILIGIQPKNMSGKITIKIKEKASVLVKIIKDKKINTLSVLK